MERIRIPNAATYLPIAPADFLLTAPIVARALFGATLPGRLLQATAVGVYAGSAALDWALRAEARHIDFKAEFGIDPLDPPAASADEREADVAQLIERLNELYQPMRIPRRELASEVDRHLTDFIAAITGQRIETSSRVREFMIAHLVFPFALGAADPLTGDVAIFKRVGIFEPHVIAHEFCHRKGYLKEVEAQILAYLTNAHSGDPVLEQSALCERLDRHLWVLADRKPEGYNELVETSELRTELKEALSVRHPAEQPYAQLVSPVMKGFTNFLLATERDA
jgi:hypothetical protein